jgi:hypothetical protein
MTGRLGGHAGLPKVQPLTQTYGQSADNAWHGKCGGTTSVTAGFDRSCDLGGTKLLPTSKRRVDRAALGACQRCSLLTQTY